MTTSAASAPMPLPVPTGATLADDLVVYRGRAADGLALRLALAPPLPGGRSLLMLTGRTEFLEKYEDVHRDLRARGFRVATIEWRGQGASQRLLADRRRGHAVDFRHFQRDLDVLLALAAQALPRPWYALAHSMGCLILLEALAVRPDLVTRAVLSAPFVGIHATPPVRALAPVLARIVCAAGFADRYAPGHGPEPVAGDEPEGNVLTSDHQRFRRYRERCRAHPDLVLGGVTWGWLDAALAAISRIRRPGAAAAITTPLLVLQAGAERVVDASAVVRVAQRLPNARRIVLDGAEHELLMERDPIRDAVFEAIDEFLR